jgi:hypothetical protein
METEMLRSVDVLIKGCRELPSHVGSTNTKELAEGIRCIISAMEAHPTSEALHFSGSSALRELSSKIPGSPSPQALLQILKSMRLFPRNELLQLQGCSSLSEIISAAHKNNVQSVISSFLEAKGVETILSAMKSRPHDLSLLNQACAALTSFSSFPKALGNAEDGLTLVIAMMATHHDVPVLQQQALHILSSVASSSFSSSSSSASASIQLRAASAILGAMEAKPSNSTLQAHGCHALRNLWTSSQDPELFVGLLSDDRFSKAFQRSGMLEDTVQAFYAALKKFPSNPTFKYHGSHCLGKQPFELVVKEGMIHAVLSALGLDQDAGWTQPAEGKASASSANAPPTASEDDIKARWAIDALRVVDFSQIPNNASSWNLTAAIAGAGNLTTAIAGAGPMDLVMASMRQQPKSLAVQKFGCRALPAIVNQRRDVWHSFVTAGGIDGIVATMLEHLQDKDIQKSCCEIFANMALNNFRSMALSIIKAGGVQRIVEAMRTHAQDAAIQIAACIALQRITCGRVYARAVSQAGVPTCVSGAMKTHKDNEQVQNSGGFVLAAITRFS